MFSKFELDIFISKNNCTLQFLAPSWLADLVLSHHLNLCGRQVRDLISDGVKISLPPSEQSVQVVPVLHGERSVHGRGDVHHLAVLVHLGSDQLRFQHCKEKIPFHRNKRPKRSHISKVLRTVDDESLDLVLAQLHMLLNFGESDLRLGLCQLHEGQQLHLGQIILMLQANLVDEFAMVLVELLIRFELLEYKNLEEVVDEFACETIVVVNQSNASTLNQFDLNPAF